MTLLFFHSRFIQPYPPYSADTTMVGEHVVVYNARDGALHRAVPVKRNITIVDTSPPIITLHPASAGFCEVAATTVNQGEPRGSSGAGKTLSIRFQFPVGALLELNCAGGQLNPDFRQLRRPGHVAILCDEASPQMVAKHKVEFQAGNSPCTLGTSRVT